MNILEIKNVKKIYSDKHVALNDVSFSVEKGSFIALLGPNGAGKSTLINILSDVVKKTAGTITLSGFDLDKDKINFKKRIGVVPQELVADPFQTPYGTLMGFRGLYGLKPDKEKVLSLLKLVSLGDKINVNNRYLSGGMKRRLLVAKSLVHDPDLVILDEPTAGVDVELRQNLWNILLDLKKQGKTVILTTHYLEEAEALCDKIAIINKGELITYKTTKELLDSFGYKNIFIKLNPNSQLISIDEIQEKLPFQCNFSEGDLSVAYKKDSDLGDIISTLVNNGLGISSFSLKESNLEDVFLKLTSKAG